MSSTASSPWADYVPFGETIEATEKDKKDDKDDEVEDPSVGSSSSSQANSWHPVDSKNIEVDSALSSSLTFRRQIRLFFAMATPYFRQNSEGRSLFGGLICLMVLDSAVRVVFSYLARDFWTALSEKDADEFYRIIRNFCIALLFLAPINVFYRFQRQRLAIRWRQWMTERIMRLYFYNDHQIYYRLEQRQQQQFQQEEHQRLHRDDNGNNQSTAAPILVDNPDQRIAEDIRSFTEYSLSFFLTITISIIDLSAFSIILYLIEPTLFLSIVGFASIGTVVTLLIGHGLVRLNFKQLKYEADFRLSLVRIRSNAESIAFFRGEDSEGRDIEKRFSNVVKNTFDIIGMQRNLEFFTTTYSYLTWILPIVVIAPQYFQGIVELGVIQQAAAAFGHVLEDLSLIINEFESLTSFTASIGRLHEFLRAVQQADPDRDEQSPLMDVSDRKQSKIVNDGVFKTTTPLNTLDVLRETKSIPLTLETKNMTSCIRMREYPPSMSTATKTTTITPYALSIHDLRLDTPNQHRHRTLISSLNVDLKWGESLLIHGESGIGKSSLLRAIAGLWTSGCGTIERANDMDTYFLPQRPYCPIGTLREQLLYPERTERNDGPTFDGDQSANREVSDSELLSILEAVNLGDLPSRVVVGGDDGNDDISAAAGLDATADWSNMLSLGEQQRLAFGRILVHRPRLVIVDEATSACDVKTEETLYNLLRNLRTGCGGEEGEEEEDGVPVTYVSVGHRPTLLGYHDRRLHIFKGNDESGGNISYSLNDIQSTSQSSSKDGLESGEVAMFFREALP